MVGHSQINLLRPQTFIELCVLGFVLGAGDLVEDRTDNTPPSYNHQKLTRTFWW